MTEQEQEEEEEQLPTVGYDLSKIKNPPQESFAYQEDAVLFQKEKGDELVRRHDVEQLIKGIFENSFEPTLKGEAKELRAGGDPAETADMLEYFAEHFKKELLEEMQVPDLDDINRNMKEPFWWKENIHTYIGGNYDKFHAFCDSCYAEKINELRKGETQ